MKPSRIVAAVTVPLMAFAMVACSTDEPASKNTSSIQEESHTKTPSDVFDSPESEEKETIADDTERASSGSDSLEILSRDSDIQSVEDAVAVVNAFFTEVANPARFEELDRIMEAEYPGWQEIDSAPDENADDFAIATIEQVYGNLVERSDVREIPEEYHILLASTILGANTEYATEYKADDSFFIETVLDVDDVTVDGNTISFDFADVYEFQGSNVPDRFLLDGVDETAPMTAEYVDGRWLVSAEDLFTYGNMAALSSEGAED